MGWRTRESPGGIEQYILTFLTVFGVCSILLFVTAIAGCFEIKTLVIVFVVFVGSGLRPARINQFLSRRFVEYLLCCLLFAFSCVGLSKLAKPYEALIHADDASIYIGAAFQLARTGSLSYQDPLVKEMTPEERSQIFNNRFATDTTGNMIRFPGGVRLVDSSKGSVVFSFYHLFPVWLAVGILFFGELSFLNILTLFLALKLVSLFLIARELGGWILAISVTVISFAFFPHLYFSLMPTSELLAETLFLSGLWVFFSGIKSELILTSQNQFIVGLLWGALFLCRLEILFMLSLPLIFLFTVIPAFSINLSRWRILILTLIAFVFLALYYQIVRGEYLYVLTSGMFLGNQTIVLIGIEFMNSTIQFVQSHSLWGFLIFLLLTGAMLAGGWWMLCRKKHYRPRLKAVLGILVILISLAAWIGPWATWTRFVKHVTWVSLYFSSPVLLTLCFGIVFYLYQIIREKRKIALLTLFILFSIPAIAYLIRPLIILEQPWAIRKFVPVVFPLFFLISLSGWLYYLKGILVRPHYAANVAFCALVVLLTGFFWSKSQYLLSNKLFDNLIAQIKNFSSTIPKDALVIVPESWAATHIQIPLQYLVERDTLVLPVEKTWNNRLLQSMNSYLGRQIERRHVMILLDPSWDRPIPLKDFYLNPVNKKVLSFEHVPRRQKLEFLDHSETLVMDYAAFNLSRKKRKNEKEIVIPYDDPNVTFVHFHGKENGFRWTQEKSMIRDFSFPIEKTSTIILSTIPIHKNDVELVINDKLPARLLKVEDGNFLFDVEGIKEIFSVTISSKTFVPSEKSINLDPRRLGICFTKLTLQRAG
jgi:hypothetical protein